MLLLKGEQLGEHHHSPLSCEENRDFWISWDRHHRYEVGEGIYVGQRLFLDAFVTHDRQISSVSMKSSSNITAEWSWPRDIGKTGFF